MKLPVRFALVACLIALGGTLSHAARPGSRLEPNAAPRRRVGTIRGKLDPDVARRRSGLQFLLDGSPRRARVTRSSFVMKNVPVGEHVLSIIDRTSNSGSHMSVDVRARSTTTVREPDLEPGGQITGIVSAVGADGSLQPLGGVEVVAESEPKEEPGGDGNTGTVGKKRTARDPVTLRLVAVTDGSGAYAFRAVPRGAYRISVVVPGYQAGLNWAWVEVGLTSVADFQLWEAIEEGVGTVAGRVTDAEGNALEGILVRVYPQDWYYPPTIDSASRARAATAGRSRRATPRSLPRGEFSTLTDQDGAFTLNLPSGHIIVEAYGDGYLPAVQELTLRPRTRIEVGLTLEPIPPHEKGRLAGRVVDAATGEPIAGARVGLLIYYIMGGGTSIVPPEYDLYSATTNEKGEYHIDEIPAGEWQVEAGAEGYHSRVLTVEIGKATAELSFELEAAKPGDGHKH